MDRCSALSLCENGTRAVLGFDSGRIAVLEVSSGEISRFQPPTKAAISSVAISSNGQRLLAGSKEGEIVSLEFVDGNWKVFSKHQVKGAVLSIAVAAVGGWAAIQIESNRHFEWLLLEPDRTSSQISLGRTNHSSPPAVFSDNGNSMLLASGNQIEVWSLNERKLIQKLKSHSEEIACLLINPSGDIALTGSADESVILWDLKAGTALQNFNPFDKVRSISVNMDWNLLVCGLDVSNTVVFKVNVKATAKHPYDDYPRRELLRNNAQGAGPVSISDDGRSASAAFGTGAINLWDLQTSSLLCSFRAESAITYCQLTPSGRHIVALDCTGHVHLLKVESPHDMLR